MNEALVDIYKEKLAEPDVDQSQVLLTFFNVAFSTNHNGKMIAQFRKLVRMFGVNRVFNAIVCSYDIENFKSENPYGILSYFCKKSLDSMPNTLNLIDTSKLEKKKTKIKFNEDPFNGD